MKKTNLSKFVKQLADEFNSEFKNLPVNVLPDGSIVYNNYLIVKDNNLKWALHDAFTRDLKHIFFLKSCALLGAKHLEEHRFDEYIEIKQIDRSYQRHYSDSLFHKHYLDKETDFDKKVILLNRLECSQVDAEKLKKKISWLFKRSFV